MKELKKLKGQHFKTTALDCKIVSTGEEALRLVKYF